MPVSSKSLPSSTAGSGESEGILKEISIQSHSGGHNRPRPSGGGSSVIRAGASPAASGPPPFVSTACGGALEGGRRATEWGSGGKRKAQRRKESGKRRGCTCPVTRTPLDVAPWPPPSVPTSNLERTDDPKGKVSPSFQPKPGRMERPSQQDACGQGLPWIASPGVLTPHPHPQLVHLDPSPPFPSRKRKAPGGPAGGWGRSGQNRLSTCLKSKQTQLHGYT